MNTADLVDRQAAERGDQLAIVVEASGDSITFAELARRIDGYARGFAAMGLSRGDRVSLFLKPGIDFVATVFALFKVGASPVFIDPGMGLKGVLSCIRRMKPVGLVAIPLVQALRPFLGSSFATVKTYVTAGSSTWYWGGTTLNRMRQDDDLPYRAVDMDPDEEGAILFTSGSTGPAKGVRYTHRILTGQTLAIQKMYGIEAGEVDVPGLPVFALFSVAMGMTVVFPEINPTKPAKVNPARLIATIEKHKATTAFGSPAIWKPVVRYCLDKGVKLPTVKRILSAGCAVPVWMHEGFARILPQGAEVHTPYGATESLPVATISSREVLDECAAKTREGAGSCVGRIAPVVEAKVIRIDDEPIASWDAQLVLPQGEIGEICVAGDVVTRAYQEEPEPTRAAKIHQGDRIWHRMGDVGYFDEQGRLWFCGRKSHRVRTESGTLFSVRLEGVFNEHPKVYRSALVGVGAPGQQEPVLVVELEPGTPRAERPTVESQLLSMAQERPLTSAVKKVLFHRSFPVDVRHNAKIKRLVLAAWAARRLGVPQETA